MTSYIQVKQIEDKYFRLRNTRTEMYTGLVACCPLVSHVECAPCDLLRSNKRHGQTDGQTLDALSVKTKMRHGHIL